MLKKLKNKKTIATLGLLCVLALTNAFPVFAGTNRAFYDMAIRSFNNTSELTHRAKETDNQYSWVRVTSISGVKTVDTKFKINDTLDATAWYPIGSGGGELETWHRLDYSNCGQPGTGVSIYLSACNHNWSTSTGSIAGTVDYE